MELTQLKKLLELATKYGVRKLKTSEVEIELGSQVAAKVEPVAPEIKSEISDEDMLFWSVPSANNEPAQVPVFTKTE